MYNIKINTLPVLTKLLQKMKIDELSLTDKELEKVRKEITSNEGKLITLSYFRKTQSEWLSYIGGLTFDRVNNSFTLPIGIYIDLEKASLSPYAKIVIDFKNKLLTVTDL